MNSPIYHAHLIPTLMKIPLAVLPALAHVMAGMADTRPVDTGGDALLRMCDPDVGGGIGKNGVVMLANARMAAMLGYTPDELKGKRVNELVVGPHDQSPPRYTCRIVPHRHKDGHIVRLKLHVYPLITDKSDRIVLFEEV